MDSETADLFDSTFLTDISTNSTSQLKNPINFDDVQKGKTFTFEIDSSKDGFDRGHSSFKKYEDTSLGLEDEMEFYDEIYFNENNPASVSKKYDHLADVFSVDEKNGDFEDIIKTMEDVENYEGQLKKLVIRNGKSNEDLVEITGKICCHYISYAEGKVGVVDSTLLTGTPYQIDFYRGHSIVGLQLAIATMKIGEISKFWIHYNLAYGELGVPPRIPKRAPILCVIEVIGVMSEEEVKDVFQMNHEERRQLPFSEIFEAAQKLRTEGNGFYMDQKYKRAVLRYRKAIAFIENYEVFLESEEKEKTMLLETLLSNLAQAHLSNKQPEKACVACGRALRLPEHKLRHKVLYKFSQAKVMLEEYEDGLSLVDKALRALNSDQKLENNEYLKWKKQVLKKKKEAEKELDLLYKTWTRKEWGSGASPSTETTTKKEDTD